MTLSFYVNNQTLTLTPSSANMQIASDSKNYLKAKFIFQTKEWENSFKYVLFKYGNKTYKKILGAEDGVAANECFVPPEVIKPGNFYISVFTADRISTNKLSVPVYDSGYTEDIENEKVTPTVMEQMNNLMYKYASVCNQILQECRDVEKSIKEEE